MIGPAAAAGLRTDLLAQLAVLGAALSYALAGVFGRRFTRMGLDPMLTATGQVAASTVLLLPVTAMVDSPWRLGIPSLRVWGALIGLAVLSTALAYILYFRLLATAGAVNLLLVTFLIPVSAVLLGSMALGEPLDPKRVLGMGLVGLGLACIDGRRFRRRQLERAARPPEAADSTAQVPPRALTAESGVTAVSAGRRVCAGRSSVARCRPPGRGQAFP
jgi:drug/metabolite transporter (DMT)-like permease